MMMTRITLVIAAFLFTIQICQCADFEFPDVTLTRAAFGSCHKRTKVQPNDNNNNNTIWETIQQQTNPQVWLWTGDAVYTKGRKAATVQALAYEYEQMKTNASLGYSTFQPPLGKWGTWDDHDYGGNDAGKELPQRRERADLFWDFLGVPAPPAREGVYSSLLVGRPPHQVKVLFLDTRWHRDDHCIPSIAMKVPLGSGFACLARWLTAGLVPDRCPKDASLLGETQWGWLQDELHNSPAAVTLIVSSIQVLTTSPIMEGWGHFPGERDRLLELAASVADKTAVYLLSGDVHHAEILDPLSIKEDTFLEVTSSGLTHDCSQPIYGGLCEPILEMYFVHRFDNRKNYYIGLNYGTINIDWDRKELVIDVRNDQGEVVLSTGPRTIQAPHPAWTKKELGYIHPTMDGHLQVWLKSVGACIVVYFVVVSLSPKRAS